MKVTKSMAEVKGWISDKLREKGAVGETAEIVANSLVYADARGTKSHGINMLEAYLERIDAGGMDVNALPAVVKESEAYAVVDARNGFGQAGVWKLTEALLEKVRRMPSVCGCVRNLNHCGALAYYTEYCAKKGYIALLFVNANPTVAPFGAMEAALGTNPLSVAVPTKDQPIVLDMASSAVAKAKIYQAAKTNTKIDSSWALDEEGNPTDDPNKAIAGVLTAMAGPKGYGIALAVEALAGVLSGAGITREVSSVHNGLQKGMNAGGFLILINPEAFLSREDYNSRMGRLIRDIKQAKPRPGGRVFLPGEIEQARYEKSKAEGIEYDAVYFQAAAGRFGGFTKAKG